MGESQDDGLLPELRELLGHAAGAGFDPTWSVAELRAAADAGVLRLAAHVRAPRDAVAVCQDAIAASDPERQLQVRIYRPASPRGVHVHLHGGGWWMGGLETVDPMARELAAAAAVTVCSVSYRLAPENPWPAAPEDAFAAVTWASERLEQLCGRSTGLSVGGESAGANLAAAAALQCRDQGGPELVALWLDVPAVDLTLPADESMRRFGAGYGLELAGMQQLVDWYVPPSKRRDPYASPAFADLTGLPRTLVTTAACDPLRDQGERFAEALLAAGVDVEVWRTAGHLHASTWLTRLTPSAAAWHDRAAAWLAAAHQLSPAGMA